jgi:glycosyltransferase involved in cell wall biosynthesis
VRACFFAPVKNPALLRQVEFYAQDLRIVEELGFDVVLATRFSELRPADLYFVWWWQRAAVPVVLARALRRPAIVTGAFGHVYEDGSWDFDRRPRLEQRLMAFGLRHADANLFIAEIELRRVTSRLKVAAPRYCPLSIDTEAYSPGAMPREKLVFSIAWLHAENAVRKCVPEIIRAAALVRREVPDVRFVIAGEKVSGYPALERLAADLGVSSSITFAGIVDRAEKVDLMRRCSAYLQPTRSEGFGLAILEAMSCGAPVVTSPVGAVPEVVGDTAKLVDGTDPAAIAEAVLKLLRDPGEGEGLGRRARERAVTLYPYTRRKAQVAEVVDLVMKKRPRPARRPAEESGSAEGR